MRDAAPRSRRARVRDLAPLGVLIAASIVIRAVAGSLIPGLWIAPDEMIYGTLGRNLYAHGQLAILPAGPTEIYSVLYPLLIGLPLAAFDSDTGYAIAKLVGVVTMSLTAVPVYLWARSLASRGWALVAAAVTLALPGLVYSGLLMTEVAFVPIVVTAAWLTARTLVDPTLLRQVALVAIVLAATATRLQAVALVPAIVTAAVLHAAFERRLRLALRLWPAVAAFAAIAAGWAAWRLRDGGPWTKILGGYGAAGESDYDVGAVLKWVVFHAGDVMLLTALFPLCAVALLAVEAARGRERDPGARAYLAVAVSLVAWFVLEVGMFASQHVERLAERDLLALAPVLFIGFAVFLHRGAPRPRAATYAIVLALAAPVLALPVRSLFTGGQIPDAPTTVPFVWLAERSVSSMELAFYGGVAVALVAFALWPRRGAPLLVVPVVLALALTSVAASRSFISRATYDQRQLLGGQRDWIDERVDSPVAYVYSGEDYWNGVWQQVFWNSSIERVYVVGRESVPGPLPQRRVALRRDGRFVLRRGGSVSERFVASPLDVVMLGEQIAHVDQHDLPDQPGLALWRVESPVRLGSVLQGVRWNGDMHEAGRLRVYACTGGTLFLTLLQKGSTKADILRDGEVVTTATFGPDGVWNGQVTVEPGPERTCTFEVRPDGFLGSTQFRFVRS